ncbi:MAG: substrate-binding domain-containing protein [Lachnospiraceae bacterium]|nr:substrate-binding domain-containing protein [Lachnospiraceae bacterium]
MMKKLAAVALAGLMVASMSVAAYAEEPVETKVGLITMDQMDVHWVRLADAAQAKVDELNEAGNKIELEWLAPETKDNAQQIEKINAAISDGCNYIIISCNDATSANMTLQEALDQGIKIIYVDAAATLEASATFATDNYAGGKQAGEYLLKVLTDAGVTEGTIGIVDAQAGVESCQNRYDGFASVFEGTDFVLGERQYSDGDNSKAQELANTLIANGVIAIYGTNDGATNGAAAAVADAANNGQTIYCVGWDKSDSNIAHVEGGELLAFMAQNPNIMGEKAIEAVVALENGEDLGGEVVDTGVSTVDASNVADFK